MTDERELNTKPAANPRWAAIDANRNSTAAKYSWPAAIREDAEKIKMYMGMAYSADEFYVNYRKRFIAVKAENPTKKTNRAVSLFNGIIAERGYEKIHTDQGLIVRIHR